MALDKTKLFDAEKTKEGNFVFFSKRQDNRYSVIEETDKKGALDILERNKQIVLGAQKELGNINNELKNLPEVEENEEHMKFLKLIAETEVLKKKLELTDKKKRAIETISVFNERIGILERLMPETKR